MPVINTNVNAIIARNAGAVNDRSMTKAMQSLSTGKRINVASDDAAGLAISTKMTSQIRGLDQAVRNANDGIAMLQVVEGATVEMTNMLQRMRELSVQSANDTNTSAERSYLNDEFQQLKNEINRISNTTQWNGVNVMDGAGLIGETAGAAVVVNGSLADTSLGGRVVRFQAGAKADQTIDFQIADFNVTSSGTVAETTQYELNMNGALSSGDMANYDTMTLSLDGTDYEITLPAAFTSLAFGADSTAAATALTTQIQSQFSALADVSITASGAGVFSIDTGDVYSAVDVSFHNPAVAADALAAADGLTIDNTANAYTTTFTFDATAIANTSDLATFEFERGGSTISVDITTAKNNLNGGTLDSDWTDFAADLEDAIQASVGATNITVTSSGSGVIVVTGTTAVDDNTTFAFKNAAVAENTVGDETNDATADGIAHAADGTTAAFSLTETAAGSGGSGDPMAAGVFYSSDADLALSGRDITDITKANLSIAAVDNALTNLNEQRSAIGAVINRLTYAADNLTNISANVTAARSRVLDTDYASATTELARTQIIQQASTAMLAQANQGAQSVLSLLK